MEMELYGIILSLVALCCSISAESDVPLVCTKEKFNVHTSDLIKTSARDFKDFVRHSDIFVDKSLLVNIVTQNASFVSLTFPEKWGKSINLDMLKTFLEIEVDSGATKKPLEQTWAYRFFKYGEIVEENEISDKLNHPPMIANNEPLISSYLGQYPVIYLDLSSFNPVYPEFAEFFKTFRKRIANAFRRHEYLMEAFANDIDISGVTKNRKQKTKKLMDTFYQYQARLVDSEVGMIASLEFLSSILRTHFNQQVYIMIDDYDVLARKSYLETFSSSDRTTKRIYNFYLKFLSKTFGKNKNARMGIVTGISNLEAMGDQSGLSESLNYHLKSKNIHPYYGFTAEEVGQLLTHCSIEGNAIEEAKENYTSHCLVDFPDVRVYDPSSILHLIGNRKVHRLANGENIEVPKKDISSIAVNLLQTYIEGQLEIGISSAAKRAAALIFEFLKIDHYQDYGYDWWKLDDLNTFYEAVAEEIEKRRTREGEAIQSVDADTFAKSEETHFAHYLLLSYMKTQYGYDVRFNESYREDGTTYRPYMVLKKGDHGAIIEFEYGDENQTYFSLARAALNRAKRFNAFFKINEEPPSCTSFIGVGLITSSSTMEIQIDVNPRYDKK